MTEILLVVKATVLVVAALLLARVGGRRVPAAIRALVLTGTFAALLILPVAVLVLPPLSVPMTPRLAGLFQTTPTTVSDVDVLIVGVRSGQTLGAGGAAESPRGDRRPAPDASTPSVVAVARLVWLAGVLIIGVRLAIGLWTLRRLRRTTVPWPEGAALARHLLGEGVAARTAIVLQPNVAAPVTYGLFRSVVALPPDAPQWPPSDLRRALIHELEHVRRADWATQILAKVGCALYWFHPVVWLAARRLRLAMEQACDDAVVRREEGTAYAEQLVIMARRLPAWSALESLAMTGRSDLSQRVGAMLDEGRARHGVSAAGAASGIVTAVVAGTMMAGLEAAPRKAQAPTVAFEVASVKRGATGVGLVGLVGNRWVAEVPLFQLIRAAYGHRYPLKEQIVGGPAWLWSRSEPFSVHAVADGLPTEEEARLLLQELRARRFGLVVHTETRKMPAYALVPLNERSMPGPGMRRVADDCDALREAWKRGTEPRPSFHPFSPGMPLRSMMYPCAATSSLAGSVVGNIASGGITMSELAILLSPVVDRPVVDRSGLTGAYLLGLHFAVPLPATTQTQLPPPLFTVVQEELGMKLEPRDELIDVLVIDEAAYPTED
jgi:uncharacterized protein (TIGR03435 family)